MMNTMSIKMDGHKMSYSLGCRPRCSFSEFEWNEQFFQLANLLERSDVANYLLNDVRVGESAIIIDEDNGVSYSVGMGVDFVDCEAVFYHERRNSMTRRIGVGREQFAVLIKDTRIAAASMFGDMTPQLSA